MAVENVLLRSLAMEVVTFSQETQGSRQRSGRDQFPEEHRVVLIRVRYVFVYVNLIRFAVFNVDPGDIVPSGRVSCCPGKVIRTFYLELFPFGF